jgi:hypothetical protein
MSDGLSRGVVRDGWVLVTAAASRICGFVAKACSAAAAQIHHRPLQSAAVMDGHVERL